LFFTICCNIYKMTIRGKILTAIAMMAAHIIIKRITKGKNKNRSRY
jgi:hypothetical protein